MPSLPHPAPTPSVALFPSSSAAPPTAQVFFSFSLPLPLCPLPRPKLRSFSPPGQQFLWALAAPSAAVRTVLDAAKSAFLFSTFPPPLACSKIPNPSPSDHISTTLVTTFQGCRAKATRISRKRRALSTVLERVPDSPRPCLPAAASAMQGAEGAC